MKVGDLINFFIVKNMPDYEAYLTCVMGGELLALLPKRFSGKTYKIGESGWASIFGIHGGGRVTLSRTSPQFIRKFLEYSLRDFLKEENISIKKVAGVRGANFYKIACSTSLLQKDLYNEFRNALPEDFKKQVSESITPIRYSENIEEYVVNAFSPAPIEAIRRVFYSPSIGIITVYVDTNMIGRFLGKNGSNISTAAKLVGKEIVLKGLPGT